MTPPASRHPPQLYKGMLTSIFSDTLSQDSKKVFTITASYGAIYRKNLDKKNLLHMFRNF